MRRIGLTGGIASGKSTVARWLRERGVAVVDADAVVHRLYRPGQVLNQALQEAFGSCILTREGYIDRAVLGQWAFSDPALRRRLEEITHPVVWAEMNREIQDLQNQGHGCVVLDIPLLYEAGWQDRVDEVWVVFCTADQQRLRLQAGRGLSREEARQRLAAQMPLEEKAARADVVIDNSGTVEETKVRLEALLKKCHINNNENFNWKRVRG